MTSPLGGLARRRADVAEAAARELISLDHRADGSFVQTPLLYPSGAYVVVAIHGGPDRYLVSDFGAGYREADLMGAGTYFSRHARGVADSAGVGFDQHAFFVLEIDRDQLAGAVATIANCSHDAVAIAAFRLADKARSDASAKVFERVSRVFPAHSIARDAEVVGSSTYKWHVATLVTIDGRRAIFDPVAPHHNSVFAATAKFHDIANLPEAPARIAMVQDTQAFSTYLNILSQASNVIELRASNKTIRSLAMAA